ncbi:RICIN domain-containing protein [Paenibacillus doosanensis]|nr:RICIN domain-containing protein [Paenibacillus doosanensis]
MLIWPLLSQVAHADVIDTHDPIEVSVDWGTTGKTIPAYAYGLNSNGLLQDSYTTDANFMSHLRYLNGNKGLVRIHSTSMISTSGWINADLTWSESKIVAALTPLAAEHYPVMINIPYGPNGQTDYLDADTFAAFAAELVRIVNVEHGLGIAYWEIPNERESGFVNPGLNASAMANLIRKSYTAMKAIDPSIQVGGPAASDVNVSYISNVVQAAWPQIDFVTMHAYSSGQSRPGTDNQAYDHAQKQGVLVNSLRSALLANNSQADLPILIDEYNMTWDTDPRLHTSKESVYSALLVAGVIGGAGSGVNFWHAESSYMGLMNDRRELYDTADLNHWFNRFFHGQAAASVFPDKSKVDGFAVKGDNRNSVLLVNRTNNEQLVRLQQSGSQLTNQAAASSWDLYRIDEYGSSHMPGIDGSQWPTTGILLPANSVTIVTSGTDVTITEHIPYTLTNRSSETLLTVTGSAYGYIHEQNRLSAQQRWVFQSVGANVYEVRSYADGSLLSIPDGTNGTITQWKLLPVGGDTFELQAAGTTSALSISNDPLDNHVRLDPDASTARQQWTLAYAGTRTEIIDHAQHLYQIVNKASGKALQIGNSRKTEGGIANLQKDEGLASQKWSFRCYADCSGFRITNANSGQVIHGAAGSLITQAPFWYDPPRQLWTLEKQADGSYVIRNNLSSQVLQPKEGSLLEGALAVSGPYTGADDQKWYISKDTRIPVAPTIDEESDYILQNLATGKVISVPNSSTANAAAVTQAAYTGNPEQLWQFKWYRSGTRIINKNSQLLLAPNSSSLSIQQTFAYHDINQQWILEKQRDGTYMLIYAANRKVLQPVGGSSAVGVRYEWVEPTGANEQKWIPIRK